MYYLFVRRLESLGDRINPITLRDLRRLRRWHVMEVLAGLYLVGTLALLFFVLRAGLPSDGEFFLFMLPAYFAGYAVFLTVGWPVFSLAMTRSSGELLDLVPLSPKEQLHGYLLTSTLLMLFFTVLLIPFNVAVQFIVSASPLYLLIPPGVFLYGVLSMLFMLPFVARAKATWEVIVAFFVVSYLGVLAVELPWIAAALFLIFVFGEAASSAWFAALLIILPFAVASLVYLAYRLSLFQFERRRMSVWEGSSWSVLGYAAWSCVWAVLYVGVTAICSLVL